LWSIIDQLGRERHDQRADQWAVEFSMRSTTVGIKG
jgi:hypothetical protein